MTPAFSIHDAVNNSSGRAEVCRNLSIAERWIQGSHFSDLDLGKTYMRRKLSAANSFWAALGPVRIADREAALRDRVLRVVVRCSKEQVVRANTLRVVAAMQDVKTWRNWPMRELVRYAVSALQAAFVRKQAVSPSLALTRLQATDPPPARIGFLNLVPEALHATIVTPCP